MVTLEFDVFADYSRYGETIALPVRVRRHGRNSEVLAHIDTGASFSIFGREVANDLELDITAGLRQRFHTATGAFTAYGHEVEICALDLSVHCTAYFFEDIAFEKNVLGRTGWLDRVRLGLVHHDSKLFLSSY